MTLNFTGISIWPWPLRINKYENVVAKKYANLKTEDRREKRQTIKIPLIIPSAPIIFYFRGIINLKVLKNDSKLLTTVQAFFYDDTNINLSSFSPSNNILRLVQPPHRETYLLYTGNLFASAVSSIIAVGNWKDCQPSDVALNACIGRSTFSDGTVLLTDYHQKETERDGNKNLWIWVISMIKQFLFHCLHHSLGAPRSRLSPTVLIGIYTLWHF